MIKFVALKVGSGDAFFLERDEATVLFDGGKSEKNFANLFYNELNITHVDILVCSHNDSDHANGIIGYLKSNLTCNEVWLPASWTRKIDTLLLNPELFFDELVENLKSNYLLKSMEHQISSESFENSHEIDVKSLLFKIENQNIDINIFKQYVLKLPKKSHTKFLKLFYDASRIREIAVLAMQKCKKIRWFEYDSKKLASGGELYFQPVNCQEVHKLYGKKISPLEYLALTSSNRESLVFYTPGIENFIDGVLYSADSDYSFSQGIPSDIGIHPIITVPHHGSISNECSYTTTQVATFVGNPFTTLVRSDGNYQSRPGPIYKSLQLKKYCTRCNGFTSGQSIQLVPTGNSWSSLKHRCSC